MVHNQEESLYVFVSQPNGLKVLGHPYQYQHQHQLRLSIEVGSGAPLLRNLSIIPDKHLYTLCRRYGYNKVLIKSAIMRGEWC